MAAATTKLVYAFAEGSRDMRELLGGKGANVAEMTRVLGADRVPAGFTITTEACVAYMRRRPRGAARARGAGGRGARAPRGAGRQAARRPERPAARVGALGRARVDARDARHGAQPRAGRRVRGGARRARPATSASRGTPTGASCRCSATSCRGRAGRALRGRDHASASASAGVEARHRALGRRPEGAHRALQGALPRRRPARTSRRSRASSCARRSARCSTRGWATARSSTGASTASRTSGARRSTCSRWCSATRATTSCSGVAFSRDEITGAPRPSAATSSSNAQGEDVVSGVRTPRDLARAGEACMPEAYAELLEILRTLERHYGDMQDTEFTVEEGRLYMLQTRNAKRPAQAAVRFAVDAVEEGLLDKRAGADRTIDAGRARRAAAPGVRPRRRVRRARRRACRASPGAAKGAIVFTAERGRGRGRGRARRDPRAAVHRGRRRGRLPRRQGHPHLRGRQGQPRRARRARAWASRACRGAAALEIDLAAKTMRVDGDVSSREGDAHRDRRQRRRGHRRRRAARGGRGRATQFQTVLGWADELRTLGVRANADTPEDAAQGARVRRRGDRPLPHRAHVHGRGPPAEDARDDHGRGRGGAPRRARRAAAAPAGATSRGCSRRCAACR